MGLAQKDVKNYWIDRARNHGDATVEFINSPKHAEIFDEKTEFIFKDKKLLHDFKTRKVLDYGCGVGRFAQFSDETSYIGVDVTASLLDIARMKNPEHTFTLLKEPKLSDNLVDGYFPQIFFTSTVLQHNNDDGVRKILASLAAITPNCDFILYENTHAAPDSAHMRFRSPDEYVILISEFFPVNDMKSRDHVVHSERHALIQIV